ncbi:MAG TPA: hypothetical protein VFH08_00410 [Chitinophagaceae bacterium]|nr:hypothetical protein [Chitinophagaceae bacterium]
MYHKIYSSLFTLSAFFLLMLFGCDKSSGKVSEENLRISSDAINNSEVLGTNYSFNLTVESVMPPSGVRISVNVVGESDNRNYSPIADVETSNKITTITLHDLPQQIYCLAQVRVTSKTKATNTATLQFRVIRK